MRGFSWSVVVAEGMQEIHRPPKRVPAKRRYEEEEDEEEDEERERERERERDRAEREEFEERLRAKDEANTKKVNR